jgi:hypothetical protein
VRLHATLVLPHHRPWTEQIPCRTLRAAVDQGRPGGQAFVIAAKPRAAPALEFRERGPAARLGADEI